MIMDPVTEFSLFPELPGEIRLKIWSFAVSISRTIVITSDRPPFKRGAPDPIQTFQGDVPAPATLHTCAESRHEALAVYKPSFETYRSKDDHFLPTGRYLHVSFEQDTFRFDDSLLVYLGASELQCIQKLVLNVKDSGYFGHFNMDLLKTMGSLKKLDLWGNKGVTYSWSRGTDRWISQLSENFAEAKEIDPGWECPDVRIFNTENDMLVHEIEGGAVIPGWTNPEEEHSLCCGTAHVRRH